MPGEAELDRMLDEALVSYAAEEPVAGLEGRIMARVSRQHVAERRIASWAPWWRWSVAAAVACLLLIMALYLARPRHSMVQRVGDVAHNPAPAQAYPLPPDRPTLPRLRPAPRKGDFQAPNARKAAPTEPEKLPKLEEFPAPSPLTAEERTMLTFAAKAPKEEKQALTQPAPEATKPLAIDPIRIAAIEIQPLPPPDDGKHP